MPLVIAHQAQAAAKSNNAGDASVTGKKVRFILWGRRRQQPADRLWRGRTSIDAPRVLPFTVPTQQHNKDKGAKAVAALQKQQEGSGGAASSFSPFAFLDGRHRLSPAGGGGEAPASLPLRPLPTAASIKAAARASPGLGAVASSLLPPLPSKVEVREVMARRITVRGRGGGSAVSA